MGQGPMMSWGGDSVLSFGVSGPKTMLSIMKSPIKFRDVDYVTTIAPVYLHSTDRLVHHGQCDKIWRIDL